MAKAGPINRESAENLAISALAFLAGDPERLGRFLSLTGIGPEAIRKAATEPAFLAGVLDHVVSRRGAAHRGGGACRGLAPDDRARAGRAERTALGAGGTLMPGFCRDCFADAALCAALRRMRLAAADRPRAARHARDRACRLRRLLRHDREARRSFAHRQAADHRRRQARRGLDRLLRGAHLRRPFGDADVQGAQALSARDRAPPDMAKYVARRPRGAHG